MNLQLPLAQSSNRVHKTYASRLEKLGITTLIDFLYHLPTRYEDYSIISPIAQAGIGETITIQGKLTEFETRYLHGNRFKTIQKATVSDDTGTLELTWFNQPYLKNILLPGTKISVSGRLEFFSKKLTLNNPEYEILDHSQNPIHTAGLIPIYPETKGISSKWLRRQIHQLLEAHPEEFPDYLPSTILTTHNFPTLDQSLRAIHFPQNLELALKARDRLAFDELFFLQLAGLKRREEWRATQTSQPLNIQKHQTKIQTLMDSLPFKLTTAQQIATGDILNETTKDKPMNRLLQGDVGSGKTIVAAITMYAAYLNGCQSTLLSPTEILATQHYNTVKNLLSPLGVKTGLVTGNKKPSVIPNVDDNAPDILIGTHALLSSKITFNNLALIIIDEQQRFGVSQRTTIRQKGKNTHLLTMTATPIPRTVALTMYGDLDVSYLNQMPHGRKPIKTWLVPTEKREGAYNWIREQIKQTNSQAFIICPFIEESETMTTIKAANKEYERLTKQIYPGLKIGLLHGKQKAKEKDIVLQDFKNQKYHILVATPVVEVGIDIPGATIIMIEAAERFGLSQLHQLRGRVGRGDKQSYCLLFTENQTPQTQTRLKSLETTHSGADLAEIDLKLRGPGNIYGTTQHGLPKLKVASFSDFPLIERAKSAAHQIFPHLSNHPNLQQKLSTITLENISPD